MIKTYAPGTLGGDIEEYCPHCDNCIGVSAEEEDSYETTCPVCGNVMKKRNGKFGEFWGCAGFPDCKYTQNY